MEYEIGNINDDDEEIFNKIAEYNITKAEVRKFDNFGELFFIDYDEFVVIDDDSSNSSGDPGFFKFLSENMIWAIYKSEHYTKIISINQNESPKGNKEFSLFDYNYHGGQHYLTICLIIEEHKRRQIEIQLRNQIYMTGRVYSILLIYFPTEIVDMISDFTL